MAGAGQRSLSHQTFMRVQYDVLRRLRSYWLPRYIMHYHNKNKHLVDRLVRLVPRLNKTTKVEYVRIVGALQERDDLKQKRYKKLLLKSYT